MLQSLYSLTGSFSETPMIASREMRRLLDTDRAEFTEAAMALVRGKNFSAGHQYALTLLVTNNLIVDKLADPRALEASEAVEIAKRIQNTIDTFLDVKLIRLLLPNNAAPAVVTDSAALLRVLEIIGAISDGSRIMTLLTQLLGHQDMRVRSKVALLIGRINHNLKWVEQRMSEADPRVRANAVESLWGLEGDEARQIFRAAAEDGDNRVAGNGALGLYRCGDLEAVESLTKMLAREESKFRATAAWAMGESGDPRFLPQLTLRISETDTCVRQNVFRAIQKIRKRVKDVQESGRLQVVITRHETQGPRRRLSLALLKGPAQPLLKFNASELVINDAGSTIMRMAVQTRREAEHLTAGFVLPRLISREEAVGQALFDSLRVLLRYKKKLDGWTATKYSSAPAAQPIAFRLESALLASGSGGSKASAAHADEESRDIEPIRFTSDPRAIVQMCESVGMRASVAENAQEAVRRLIDAMCLVRGNRSVFLFATEPVSESGWDDLRTRAREARVTVNALAYRTDLPAELIRLCGESGGAAAGGDSAEQLVASCERVAASLASLHTVEYEMPKAGSGAVKVQIYSEAGYGEDTIQS